MSATIKARRWWIGVIAAILVVIGVCAVRMLPGRGTQLAGQRPVVPAVPVVAAAARQGDIHVYLTGLGTVSALYTATMLPQVTGQILHVPFKEGDIVKKGALLVQIDPRPYEAALLQMEGQLARDKALLEAAMTDFKRYDILAKQDSIALQQRDDQLYLVHQYEGTVKLDEGLVRAAKINLGFTSITSPFTGRIGLRLVDPGNILYTPATTGVAVVTQTQPITVIFPIQADNLPSVLEKLRAGKSVPVDALNRDQTQKIASGHLLTADNLADTTTGTIRLKAIFENKNNALFPNQFVNARLLMDTMRRVTLIPSVAIQSSPQGTFVYLVNKDRTVKLRYVKAGVYEKEEVSIKEGVSPGDMVVVQGAEKLKEGARVQLQTRGSNAPGENK